MTWAPFVIYADLKSILLSVGRRAGSTHLYQNHKLCAASAFLCSTVDTYNNQFHHYTGENAVVQLLDQLIKWEGEIVKNLNRNIKMRPLRSMRDRAFDLESPNDRKVADHDHVTRYYFGAAHDECNRKRRVVYDIPVFFHNFCR